MIPRRQETPITLRLNPAPADFLTVLHAAAPWARHRTLEECRVMLMGSAAAIVAYDGYLSIGCARAISDGVTRAYIEDVAVMTAYRRRGIATRMIEALEAALCTPGLTPFTPERIELVSAVPEFWISVGYRDKPTHHMVKVLR